MVASKMAVRGGRGKLLKWRSVQPSLLLARAAALSALLLPVGASSATAGVHGELETPAEEELLMWWATRAEGRLWLFRERGRRRGERRLPATAAAGW